jgi:hypothetical protein
MDETSDQFKGGVELLWFYQLIGRRFGAIASAGKLV